MRIAVTATVLALASAIGASTLDRAAAQSSARVVDRTFLCATSLNGGIRELEARAHTGARSGTRWAQLPFAAVSSGSTTIWGDLLRPETLAFITAGRPTPETTIDQENRRANAFEVGRLAVNTRACRPTSKRVPFTRTGLNGGRADRFGDEHDCEVPRRVLLRVRAELIRPDRFERVRTFERLNVPIRTARLTARTETGRVVLDAEVFESGRATLHTGRACFRG